jgi:hypothetical protein
MLFGDGGKTTEFLLKILGREPGDFGRFRSVYVTEDYIVVHTRNGGGNREYYEDYLEDEDHPLYSHNEDCDYDETYADIFYNHPEEYKELLVEMANNTLTPSERWKNLLESMNAR